MRARLSLLLCGALCACAHAPRPFGPGDRLSADDHFHLGSAYEEQGLKDDAARQYKRALRLDSSDPEVWVASGNAKFKRGDVTHAENDYLHALGLAGNHADAQNHLALAYLAQNKKLKDAERLAKTALRENATLRPYVLDTLAKIYQREGRCAEALATAAQAEEEARFSGLPFPPPDYLWIVSQGL
jgi:tetratricopeptide (TPR) repeat protein